MRQMSQFQTFSVEYVSATEVMSGTVHEKKRFEKTTWNLQKQIDKV